MMPRTTCASSGRSTPAMPRQIAAGTMSVPASASSITSCSTFSTSSSPAACRLAPPRRAVATMAPSSSRAGRWSWCRRRRGRAHGGGTALSCRGNLILTALTSWTATCYIHAIYELCGRSLQRAAALAALLALSVAEGPPSRGQPPMKFVRSGSCARRLPLRKASGRWCSLRAATASTRCSCRSAAAATRTTRRDSSRAPPNFRSNPSRSIRSPPSSRRAAQPG